MQFQHSDANIVDGAEESEQESQDHPQDQEIEDYAKFLGMDPNSSVDRELMYIAKQGLMEPVPAPWEA